MAGEGVLRFDYTKFPGVQLPLTPAQLKGVDRLSNVGFPGAGPPPAGQHMAFRHILREYLDQDAGAMVPVVVRAEPSFLTTTFFDAKAAGVVTDPGLQGRLDTLING